MQSNLLHQRKSDSYYSNNELTMLDFSHLRGANLALYAGGALFVLALLAQVFELEKVPYKSALSEITELANRGNARAQFLLASAYLFGLGVNEDTRVAAEWFNRSAKQDYLKAGVVLGYMYETGLGVDLDKTTAEAWYHKAQEQGITDEGRRGTIKTIREGLMRREKDPKADAYIWLEDLQPIPVQIRNKPRFVESLDKRDGWLLVEMNDRTVNFNRAKIASLKSSER